MLRSPKESLKAHLDQLIDNLSGFELAYRDDSGRFLKYTYEPAIAFLERNAALVNKADNEICQEYLAIAEFALEKNKKYTSQSTKFGRYGVEEVDGIAEEQRFQKRITVLKDKIRKIIIGKDEIRRKNYLKSAAPMRLNSTLILKEKIKQIKEKLHAKKPTLNQHMLVEKNLEKHKAKLLTKLMKLDNFDGNDEKKPEALKKLHAKLEGIENEQIKLFEFFDQASDFYEQVKTFEGKLAIIKHSIAEKLSPSLRGVFLDCIRSNFEAELKKLMETKIFSNPTANINFQAINAELLDFENVVAKVNNLFLKAQNLEERIDFLRKKLAPDALAEGIFSGPALERHKSNLLQKLELLPSIEKIFVDGGGTNAKLDKLEKKITELEKNHKLVQLFYDRAASFYKEAYAFYNQIPVFKDKALVYINVNLQSNYIAIIQKAIEEKLLELIDPDRFLKASDSINFDAMKMQVDHLEESMKRIDGFMRVASTMLEQLIKNETYFQNQLSWLEKNILHLNSMLLKQAYTRLKNDFLNRVAEIRSAIIESSQVNPDRFAAKLSNRSKFVEEYRLQWLEDLDYLKYEMVQSLKALEVAVIAFEALETHDKDFQDAPKQWQTVSRRTKEAIIAIVDRRPVDIEGAEKIYILMREFSVNDSTFHETRINY